MKILHVIAEKTLRGGTEILCVSLIKALKEGNTFQEIIVREGTPSEIADNIRPLHIPIHVLPLQKRCFKTFWGLRKITRTFKPDIIVSWLPRASELIPKGAWIHCAQVTWHRGIDGYEKANYLIVPTRHMKTHFSSLGVPSTHIEILPHFTYMKEGTLLPKKTFNTPKNAFIVLGLGRLDSVKGFDLLIKALYHLSNPHIHLWLAGEGSELDNLQHLTQELNLSSQVHFLGWQNNTADILKTADLIVVPSRQEALGLIILEAWKNRCPIIATSCPGPLHLITSRKDGLLIPIENPKAIAQGIESLYMNENLRKTLIDNGYKKVESHHTPYQATKAYKAFFQKILRHPKITNEPISNII